jgi:hypothetical protein
MARFSGILRPSRNRPPAAATSERFTSGMPKVADRDATIRSHDSVISVPPANAGPSTAAMIGLVRSRWTIPAKPPRLVASPPALPLLISFRSAPAQNTGGVPVRTPTQTSSLSSIRSMPASIPLATAAFTALRAWGRLIVMMA